MPTLDHETVEEKMLLRELCYGAPKTQKTWWAGAAAEAGFNVVLIDGDHGYHILHSQLSPQAKKRVMVIGARDSVEQATFAVFMGAFLKMGYILWDEATNNIVAARSQITPTTIELRADRLNENCLFICDSATALVDSINHRYAIENRIDPTEAAKQDWPGFGWTGRLMMFIMERMTKLPSHVALIAHQTMYEKRNAEGKVEWSRMIFKSTSNPNAMTIPDKFSDVLWFHRLSSAVTKIDTRSDREREGGSRLIPPGDYEWSKLQFADVCKLAGIPLPPPNNPYIDFTPTPVASKRSGIQLSRADANKEAKPTEPTEPTAKPVQGGNIDAVKTKPTGLKGLQLLKKAK